MDKTGMFLILATLVVAGSSFGNAVEAPVPAEKVAIESKPIGQSAEAALKSVCSGDPNGYYPDPSDCTKFYQCKDGNPTRHNCPSNLHYNPRERVCDWPDRAGCTAGSGWRAP